HPQGPSPRRHCLSFPQTRCSRVYSYSSSANSFASLYRWLIKFTSRFGVAMPFFDFFWKACSIYRKFTIESTPVQSSSVSAFLRPAFNAFGRPLHTIKPASHRFLGVVHHGSVLIASSISSSPPRVQEQTIRISSSMGRRNRLMFRHSCSEVGPLGRPE